MHELHNQERIDILFCGASHVSHGLLPSMMDEKLGKSTFCSGTPSQGIYDTYAIIQDAVSYYDIEEIFLEMDFAVSAKSPVRKKSNSTVNRFLATHYLKNQKVKLSYLAQSTTPEYYLNEILPIGQNKLIDLNPITVIKNMKSKLTGEYYNYVYNDENSEYMHKGCVFDHEFIENGTFFSYGETPINIGNITEDYKNIIRKIIKLCEKENIKLTFYAQSNSDFYLCEKGNYDEYHAYIKDFLNSEGFKLYDFNLCKENFLSFEDADFSDDNHLNKSGIIKFTNAFCEFYKSEDKEDWFHQSYKERLFTQEPKILGLMLNESSNKKTLQITPVINHGDISNITYTVSANLSENDTTSESEYIKLLEHSTNNTIDFPDKSSGKLEIHAYYNDIMNCHITIPFFAL